MNTLSYHNFLLAELKFKTPDIQFISMCSLLALLFFVLRNTTSALPLLSVLLTAMFLAYQLRKLLVFYLRYLDGCAFEIKSCITFG